MVKTGETLRPILDNSGGGVKEASLANITEKRSINDFTLPPLVTHKSNLKSIIDESKAESNIHVGGPHSEHRRVRVSKAQELSAQPR
jgi:hypothetical protein